MARYDFKDTKTGETVELSMPMAEAPSIGSVIEHEGRSLKRLPSDFVASQVDRGFNAFRSSQLEDHCPHAKDFDKNGRPVFKTGRDLDNCIDRVNNDPRSMVRLERN